MVTTELTNATNQNDPAEEKELDLIADLIIDRMIEDLGENKIENLVKYEQP